MTRNSNAGSTPKPAQYGQAARGLTVRSNGNAAGAPRKRMGQKLRRKRRRQALLLVTAVPLILTGLAIYGRSHFGHAVLPPSKQTPAAQQDEPQKEQEQKRVTDRPGNTMGRVVITMYHHFRKGRGDMFCPPERFLSDLELYYKLGFRPVLASDYIENKMTLPPGASPIVMTFDDSHAEQILLKKDGTVTDNCAVGVWMKFAKTHPDFPVHGTFFAISDNMFGRLKELPKKLKILKDLGCEIGNHTVTHPFLNRLTDDKVKWELGHCSEVLAARGIEPPHTMAVPYGVFPRNKRLFRGFSFHGKKVTFEGVFRADGPPARSPIDPKFDKYNIPRIVAGTHSDSVRSYLRMIARGDWKLYVQP